MNGDTREIFQPWQYQNNFCNGQYQNNFCNELVPKQISFKSTSQAIQNVL